ncbi:MAG: T9SS type A sorting domain-containing protein [Hymenobacter sp.]|nr:MAG: T9SS type A sorting domain-containing protein [Hymenobacter sp.]
MSTGNYTLKATPYTGSGNTGTAGTPLTIAFTITNPAPITAQPQALYRINAGGGQLVTSLGTFQADMGYMPAPGLTANTTAPIAKTDDAALYQDERRDSGRFNYILGVPNGRYTIVLHFAETQWNATGKRLFDVIIEGKRVLDNYDIYKKVGANTAITETFTTNVTDGTLLITFSSLASDGGVDQPTLAALQVLSAATGSLTGNKVNATATTTPENGSELSVYPNPTIDGQVTVTLPALLEGDLHYTLLSATGSVVAAASVALDGSTTSIPLNLARAMSVPGIYYLRLTHDSWSSNIKISRTDK